MYSRPLPSRKIGKGNRRRLHAGLPPSGKRAKWNSLETVRKLVRVRDRRRWHTLPNAPWSILSRDTLDSGLCYTFFGIKCGIHSAPILFWSCKKCSEEENQVRKINPRILEDRCGTFCSKSQGLCCRLPFWISEGQCWSREDILSCVGTSVVLSRLR